MVTEKFYFRRLIPGGTSLVPGFSILFFAPALPSLALYASFLFYLVDGVDVFNHVLIDCHFFRAHAGLHRILQTALCSWGRHRNVSDVFHFHIWLLKLGKYHSRGMGSLFFGLDWLYSVACDILLLLKGENLRI